MIHKGTKTIETERLILRPFRQSDVEPMFRNWASDPEVTKFMTWPVHESVAVTKHVVEAWMNDYKDSRPTLGQLRTRQGRCRSFS